MSVAHPFRRHYQRAAIARSYATRWRAADPGELAGFIKRVTECPADVYAVTRRREVGLSVGRYVYRVVLRPGADVMAEVIDPADVERFETRQD